MRTVIDPAFDNMAQIESLVNPLPDSVAHYINVTMPSLDGWCSPPKAEALARLIIARRPAFIVEIGVWGGRSLALMAIACNHLRHGTLIGIDPWSAAASAAGEDREQKDREWWARIDHDRIYEKCLSLLRSEHVMHRTALIRAESALVAPTLAPVIDLLHIDGNHSEAHSVADVTAYVPLVRTGGTVVFDDTNWATTKRAQELLAQSCALDFMVEGGPGQQCAFYTKK